MAITATHLAACAGALTWGAIEWATRRKPSVLGMISGAVAGLGTITPASGFVAPWHGIVIGIVAGLSASGPAPGSSTASTMTTRSTCSASTASAALTGTLLAGVFAVNAIGGTAGLLEGNPQQVLIQLYGDRGHAGVVRRRHLRAAQAGQRVRAAAGVAAAGARRPRYFAARRGAAVSHPPRIPFSCPHAGQDYVADSGVPTI